MKNLVALCALSSMALFVSCATSKSPSQFYSLFPTLTKSTFLSKADIESQVGQKQCKLITENRQYSAPVAGSVKGDMKKGARGVDELVQLDGGNAYLIKSFNWKNFDSWGSTQLHLEFDTYNCDK